MERMSETFLLLSMLGDVDTVNHVQLVLYLLLIPIIDTVARKYNQNLHLAVVHRELESYHLNFLLVAFSWRVVIVFLTSVRLRIPGNEKFVLGVETFCILIGLDFGQILLWSFVRGRIARNLHQLDNDG